MKHRKRKLLSILLAASLVFQSAGITAQAANNDVSDDIVDIIEVDDLSDIPLLTDYSLDDPMSDDTDISSEINDDISEAEIAEEISSEASEAIEEDSAENVVIDSDESIAETRDETPEETLSEETPDTEDSSVDAPPAEDVSDGDLFPGLPAEYKLSDEQMAQKKVLSEHMSDIAPYEAKDNSSLYAEGELVYLTDSAEEAQMVADAFGGELESYYLGVAVIVIPENRTVTQAIMSAADPDFNLPAVWPNYYKHIYASHNDPALSEAAKDYQWQHSFVGDSYAWDAGYKGQGVKVAVLDTGLLDAHEEFTGRVAKHLSMLSDTATTSTSDTQGHGTHVAGIIAANLDNSKGGAGIAPESSLYIYGIGNSDGTISSAAEYRAINQAINDKVDIINMSLGSGFFDANENTSIQKAYNAGIAVFAAAGNESTTGTSYPASFDHVCSVASLQQDGRKSYFTNYNSSVDLAFPGTNIYSTSKDGAGSYTYKSGTSMATPVASGVAAVILSGSDQIAELKGKTGTKRVDALYKVMSSNAVKSPSSGTGSGTTYLPKVFKINTSKGSDVPAVPTFVIDNKPTNKATTDSIVAQVEIKGGSEDIEIWFNMDGKTPSYKNGTVTNGEKYTAPILMGGAKKITVKAIAVNKASGKASKAASATCTFTPNPLAVEIRADGVHKLSAGSKLSLKAVVTPSYAVSTKVKWEVSPVGDASASGVSINASGKLSVDKKATPGKYMVKATAVDKKGNAYASNIYAVYEIEIIAPESAVKSIALGEKSKTIEIGGTAFDAAKDIKVTYANGKAGSAADVVWSSSNTNIAVVSADGKVVGRAPGKVNIKATANDGSGKSATCKIVVNQPAVSLKISGCEKLAAGKSVALKASIAPENISVKTLDWKVEGGSGITVKNGKVSASKNASGTCTVTATTKGEHQVSDSITITIVKDPIKSIKIDKSVTLFSTPGNYGSPTSKALTTTIEGGDSTAIRFESSAPGIVSVNNAGVVSAVSAGKAKITCMATDGSSKKAVCTVTVSAPMSRLTIVAPDDNAGCVSVGSTLKLKAETSTSFGAPQNKKVNWSVEEGSEKLISVSSSGVVKALSAGNENYTYASVKAEAADGSGASDVYKVLVFRKITAIQLIIADNKFVPLAKLDNGAICSVPFSTSFSYSNSNKIGYQTKTYLGCEAFTLIPEKATTQKSHYAQMYTTDAIKVSIKIKMHPNGKTISKSAYVLRTSDGYILNTDK